MELLEQLGNKKQALDDPKYINLQALKKKISKVYFSESNSLAYVKEIEEKGFGSKSNSNANIPFYIISPYSKLKLTWDIFLGVLIIIQLMFIPIDAGFIKECLFPENVYFTINTINLIMYLLFAADIAANFITALVDEKGLYNYDIKEIAMTYLKSIKFITDVIAVMPFEIMLNEVDMTLCFINKFIFAKQLKLLLYLRASKLSRLNEMLEKFTPAKLIPIYRLFKLLAVYFYLIFFIGTFLTAYSPSLLQAIVSKPSDYQRTTEQFGHLITYCVFTGVYIVLGNDLALSKNYERVILILINIVSLVANGYVFGYVANLLSGAGGSEGGISNQLDKMKEFLIFHGFKPKLNDKIEKYYTIMFKRQRDLFMGEAIFADVSELVLVQAKFEMWKDIYFSMDKLFLNDACSSEFLNDSLKHMKAKVFLENERIVNEGEKSCDFYFITSGARCQVLIHGIIINILHEGDTFGEVAIFLQSGRRSASIQSISVSDFIYIPGECILKILRDHPEAAEYIKERAFENFYRTISITRIKAATRLLGGNSYETIFKRDLYSEENKSVEKKKYVSWNVESVNALINKQNDGGKILTGIK
jgi:CRP-like cAMP-binding protein